MKKRLLALLLSLALVVSLLPAAVVHAEQSDDEILMARRQAVYDEMYRMATVLWRATESFTYVYSGTEVNIVKGRLYRGIPYTHARSNYESFMELLSEPNEKGEHEAVLLNSEMLSGGSSQARFGNDCSGATSAAYAKISTTVQAAGSSTTTPSRGYLRVSPEKYVVMPSNTKNEKAPIHENGEQVMYSIYADALLADIFTCNGHNIMAQYVHVEYAEDGSIDGEKSYLIFTHQTPAPISEERYYKTGEFAEENYGEKVYVTYQLDHKWSFSQLYSSGYSVVTCKELIDPSPIPADAYITDTLAESEHNFENLLSGSLVGVNGLIESVTITITDENGNQMQKGTARAPRNTNSATNHAMVVDLSQLRYESPMKILGTIKPHLLGVGNYHCQVDCKMYSGQIIEKVRDYDFTVTAEDLPDKWVDNSNISDKFEEGTTMAVCPVCGGDPVEWTALTKIQSNKALTAGGHYYLTKDISNGSHYSISGGTACVHLNGHNLTSAGRVFYASTSKGTFNLMGNGLVVGGNTESSRPTLGFGSTTAVINLYGGTYGHVGGSKAATVQFESAGKVNMYSGATICKMGGDMGNKNVYVNQGTFNMYGGLIADGYDYESGNSQYGGNLKVGDGTETKATFNMYGGYISGGMAQYAGNVFVYGTGAKFNMQGGEVYLGIGGVRDGQGSGGNVYVSGGATATLNGLIHYGKAAGQDVYGGGNIIVRGGSKVTIGGTVIKGNGDYDSDGTRNGSNIAIYEGSEVTLTGTIGATLKAAKMGGNVYVRGATLTVDGGTISNGVATYRGGNIGLQGSNTKLVLKNGAKVLDGVAPTDGKYSDWGGNIYATSGAVIEMEGNGTEVSGGISHTDGGMDICLFDGAVMTMSGGSVGNLRVSAESSSYSAPALYMYSGTIKDILDKGENAIQLYNGTLGEKPTAEWLAACACYTKVSSTKYTIGHTGQEGVVCPNCGLSLHTGDHVLGADHLCDTCGVVNATIGETQYSDISDALQSAVAGDTVVLKNSATIKATMAEGVTVDLNGFHISGTLMGADTCVYDSQTDDYTVSDDNGYGLISGTVSGVKAAEGYALVTEDAGISFHKVNVALDKLTLKPASAGLYYTGSFLADEVIMENATVGVVLSTSNEVPVADDSDPACLYTATANSVLLKNIMSQDKLAAENAANAKTKVYARAYVKLADGTYIYSDVVVSDLQSLVETIDAKLWDNLSAAQKEAFVAMYQLYSDAMSGWNIPNLKNA